MKLEFIVLPVADVERAKNFYMALGWREDLDIGEGDAPRDAQGRAPGFAPDRQSYFSFASFNDPDGSGKPGSRLRRLPAAASWFEMLPVGAA